jgi:hypothetical protein
MTPVFRWCAFAVLSVACAGSQKRQESAPPPRVKDSAPERAAATRAAGPASLRLESEDERWGIEAAQERKRQEEAKKAAANPDGGASKQVTPLPPPR